MGETFTYRQDVEVATLGGNVTSTIIHQGENFWIINHIPWHETDINQCICATVEDPDSKELIYPINFNWVLLKNYISST